MAVNFESMKRGYANLYSRATIKPERLAAARKIAAKLTANRLRYEAIAVSIGCPWWFIAVLHQMESDANFATYLGNGQRLDRVTTIVPKGRGPFKTFEAGALDALRIMKMHEVKDWSIERCLYEIERFNGFGYISKGINSPYVWSFTNLYAAGKFVSDGRYDPRAVSTQCGAAAILKCLDLENKIMAELKAQIEPFAGVAPILISTLSGGAASLAVRALADALGDGTQADQKAVAERLGALPLGGVVSALKAAESVLSAFVPAAPVADPITAEPAVKAVDTPVAVQPVEPAASWWDKIIPQGLKTPLGIVIYVGGTIAGTMGWLPPEVAQSVALVGGGVIGIGLKSMLDRWLPVFAGFLKRT